LTAVLYFRGEGVAIIRRAALDDIGNIDLLAIEVNGSEQPIKELPGLSDEGASLLVFVPAGCLADKYDIGVFRALTGYYFCA